MLADRFIPNRFAHPQNSCIPHTETQETSKNNIYESYIKQNILSNNRLLNFYTKQYPTSSNQLLPPKHSQCSQQSTQDSQFYSESAHRNIISQVPEKVLDAPNLRDDFYLNIVDWSVHGPLAIALENQVYLYTPRQILQICKVFDGNYVSSVRFHHELLSVGFSNAKIQIYDINKCTMIRQIHQHQKRVSAQEFNPNNNILYSGSKDKAIVAHDLKAKNTVISRLEGHRGEVCSLKKEPGLNFNLASGSNDNSVLIWDSRKNCAMLKYQEHRGAVKALSWCPWRSGVIGSAGGAGDRTIRIWSINNYGIKTLNSTKTSSQISSLVWNRENKALVSGHGGKKNEINVWEMDNLGQGVVLEHRQMIAGHRGRILGLQQSSNEDKLCSYGADETIRFWNYEKCSMNSHEIKQNQQFHKIQLK